MVASSSAVFVSFGGRWVCVERTVGVSPPSPLGCSATATGVGCSTVGWVRRWANFALVAATPSWRVPAYRDPALHFTLSSANQGLMPKRSQRIALRPFRRAWGRKNSQGSCSRTLLWSVAETKAPRLKSVPPTLQMSETSQPWPEFKIAIATPIPKGAGPFMKIKLTASAPRSRFPATLRVDAR
jgi:hypothetical protein